MILWLLFLPCLHGFMLGGSGLRVTPGTAKGSSTALNANLIVGVNKYSHDASCCIIDSDSGKVLFTQAKERISGRKHDGGSVGSIVKHGLKSIHADLNDVVSVVSNNHHHRVNPFEERINFNKALNYISSEYDDEYNLFPGVEKLELSHHLAHAWSAVGTAPFDQGVALVMDGMGESRKAMVEDMLGLEEKSGDYMHDLKLLQLMGLQESELFNHIALSPASTYREAETAYLFDRARGLVVPVFKRWARERSPSELYNHGFENIDSIGAVYSRVSAHINGDWNACGKVMGLAPWADRTLADAAHGWYFGPQSLQQSVGLDKQAYEKVDTMTGNPLEKNSFKINWMALEGLDNPNAWSNQRFGELASLAQSVQTDLESVTLAMCESLREVSNVDNLALAGGVALNSVMNGKIRKQSGFKEVFVPSAPGDEGIALGCALYGLQRWREKHEQERRAGLISAGAPQSTVVSAAPIQPVAFPAYQGKEYTAVDVHNALFDFDAWITVQEFESESDMVADAAASIASGKVVAWYQGRSEFGQRALGARSILADPRKRDMRKLINEKVKEREWYRPLAPSVLDEHVGEWFEDLQSGENASPYMSLTATVRPERESEVPAVCHVDGTARLQTVTKQDAPLYHRLLSLFYKITGVPMVLNTSFNRKSQPIVETPAQAVETLLQSGSIDHMYMGLKKVIPKPFPLDTTLPVPQDVRDDLPSDEDERVAVFGTHVYLSELTSGDSATSNVPLRVRIQTGGSCAVDEELAAEVGSEELWLDLPSAMHLDMLQILRAVRETMQEQAQPGEPVQGLPAGHFLPMLAAFSGASRDENEIVPWSKVRDVLQWLHARQLVSFGVVPESTDPKEVYDKEKFDLSGEDQLPVADE